MLAADLVGAVKNWLQPGQVGNVFNLLIENLYFVQRIEAIGAHDAIVH